MKWRVAACVFIGCIIFVLPTFTFAETKGLQADLTAAFAKYTAALKAGDEAQLKAATSSYSYANFKNSLASRKRDLTPDFLKMIVADMPDPSKMTFEI